MVLMAVQASVAGLYLPPVLGTLNPPQIIISVPVHTAVVNCPLAGALVVLTLVQVSVAGSYFPPVEPQVPPQTIISLPVQTAA